MSKARTCKQCGFIVYNKEKFCPQCGNVFTANNSARGTLIFSISIIVICTLFIGNAIRVAQSDSHSSNSSKSTALFSNNVEEKILGKWKRDLKPDEIFDDVIDHETLTPLTYILEFYNDGRVSKTTESDYECYWYNWKINDNQLIITPDNDEWEDVYNVKFENGSLVLNWVIDMAGGTVYERPWGGVFDSAYFSRID